MYLFIYLLLFSLVENDVYLFYLRYYDMGTQSSYGLTSYIITNLTAQKFTFQYN